MGWLILVLVGTLFWSITTLLQRAFLKEEQSDAYTYAIVFQLLVSFSILIYVLFTDFNIPSLKPILFNLVLMTILYAVANFTLYKGLQLIEASEMTILLSSKSIWTMWAATIFLNEKITPLRIIGTLLIISGVIVISWKKKVLKFNKGYTLILISAALFGLAFTNDAFILKVMEAPSFSVLAFGFPAIALLLIRPKSFKELRFFFQKNRLIKVLEASLFYSIAAVTIYAAYRAGGNVSQISPITQLTIVINVILSYIFLKERNFLLRKIIGSLLALVGVLLIAF
jgi:drug/metabolite transporter (DMT)-like permease